MRHTPKLVSVYAPYEENRNLLFNTFEDKNKLKFAHLEQHAEFYLLLSTNNILNSTANFIKDLYKIRTFFKHQTQKVQDRPTRPTGDGSRVQENDSSH